MIAAGTYRAKAVDAVMGYTRNGNRMIEILFDVEGAEQLSFMGVFTDKSTPYVKAKMQAAGWIPGQSLDTIRGTCDLRVSYEDYQGKQQLRVDIVTPFVGLRTQPQDRLSPKAVDAFLKELHPAAADATPLPTASIDETDDSLPF